MTAGLAADEVEGYAGSDINSTAEQWYVSDIGIVNRSESEAEDDEEWKALEQKELREQLTVIKDDGHKQSEVDEERIETEITEEMYYDRSELYWYQCKFRTRRIVWPVTGSERKLQKILELRKLRGSEAREAVVGTTVEQVDRGNGKMKMD